MIVVCAFSWADESVEINGCVGEEIYRSIDHNPAVWVSVGCCSSLLCGVLAVPIPFRAKDSLSLLRSAFRGETDKVSSTKPGGIF